MFKMRQGIIRCCKHSPLHVKIFRLEHSRLKSKICNFSDTWEIPNKGYLFGWCSILVYNTKSFDRITSYAYKICWRLKLAVRDNNFGLDNIRTFNQTIMQNGADFEANVSVFNLSQRTCLIRAGRISEFRKAKLRTPPGPVPNGFGFFAALYLAVRSAWNRLEMWLRLVLLWQSLLDPVGLKSW